MNWKYWTLTLMLLLLVNAAWIWRLDRNSMEFNERMSESQNRVIETDRELYLLNRDWEYNIKTSGLELPPKLQCEKQETGTSDLGRCLSEGERLILVLSARHCSTCIDQLLFLLKAEVPQFYRRNLLILFSPGDSPAKSWQIRRKILPGAEFAEISDYGLGLPMDSLDNPYFIVSGPGMRAGMAFVPYPALESQTADYLNMVKNKLFN